MKIESTFFEFEVYSEVQEGVLTNKCSGTKHHVLIAVDMIAIVSKDEVLVGNDYRTVGTVLTKNGQTFYTTSSYQQLSKRFL